MTLNDILSGKKAARVFYAELHGTTITEAAKEPLKLRDVATIGGRTVLPTSEPVDYATALCFVCLQTLMGRFARKYKPDESAIAYMAKQMTSRYLDWSVLDLPTFVDMCLCSRIPSVRLGETEYELVTLDIPSIMSKVEGYDKMRPNALALQGNSPAKAPALQPIKSKHYGMLMDGTPYDFSVPYEDFVQGYSTPSGDPKINAERYWRASPHNGERDFDFFYARFRAKLIGQDIIQPVNKVLGLQ